ncbi:hypothetical protein GFV16_11395 [Bacillus megaterium]|uniref:hypothetical protein n=1 Tax=Priestia megaterium TaxID=1404 RepID=UPI001293A5D8|nr:hypothetical protein [Priestia megaterium]MQR86516.1 hypothetical protein [Priestia megaterium]
MKKLMSLLLIILLSLSAIPSESFATEKTPNEDTIKEIKKHYKNSAVQKRLIEKVEKGQTFDSMNPKKQELGIEKEIDENIVETTYPDGSQTVEGIDFSEAKFYNEDGKEIENPYTEEQNKLSVATIFTSLKSLIEPTKAQAAVISGGTKSSGSGYSCVKGAKVFKEVYSAYSATFYANWCNNSGAYDEISRIYGEALKSSGSYSWISKGIFRSKETSSYSAYGGIKFDVKPENRSMSTEYLYLRVGSDKYWYQSSF